MAPAPNDLSVYTFPLLLHKDAAMGRVSVMVEVRKPPRAPSSPVPTSRSLEPPLAPVHPSSRDPPSIAASVAAAITAAPAAAAIAAPITAAPVAAAITATPVATAITAAPVATAAPPGTAESITAPPTVSIAPVSASVVPVATVVAEAAVVPGQRLSRKRKAAVLAAGKLGEEYSLDETDSSAPVRKKAVQAPTHSQTIDECLSGRFAHLKPIDPSPTLAEELEEPSHLHGKLMAFHWQEWGWCVGRIGPTSAGDSNVSALYINGWREDHALFESDYGLFGDGSWVLLEAQRPASPLLDYDRNKYKVMRDGVAVWLRSDQLVHHSGSELAACRDKKAQAAADASQAAVDEELSTGGFAVGSRVYAQGRGGDGEMAWFVSRVVAHRERFPPYVPDIPSPPSTVR